MQEVSAFIQTSLSSLPHTSAEDAKKAADTYQGLAEVFQRISNDVRAKAGIGNGNGNGKGGSYGEGEVDVLLDFAEKGKVAVSSFKESQA